MGHFVSHHLEEIGPDYWREYFSTDFPDQNAVLNLLEPRSHWGGVDNIDVFDFTLPGESTNYVISVRFDQSGDVCKVDMES